MITYFNNYDVAAWGGELATIDIEWLDGWDGTVGSMFSSTIVQWNANPTKWPK